MTSNIGWLYRLGYIPEVWNFVTGCNKVSEGCRYCYAEALSHRFGWTTLPWTLSNEAANVVVHEDRIHRPCTWRKPRMVFVNSMSDLFHTKVPIRVIEQAFDVMAACQQHLFVILTKRPQRPQMLAHWPDNVWLGVSIESSWADWRRIELMKCGAKVRFVSFEPLLAPPLLTLYGLDWVIVGGESGPNYRHMEMSWARDIRDRCDALNIPFFFKQESGRYPGRGSLQEADGSHWLWHQWPGLLQPPVPIMPREYEREGRDGAAIRDLAAH